MQNTPAHPTHTLAVDVIWETWTKGDILEGDKDKINSPWKIHKLRVRFTLIIHIIQKRDGPV